MNRSFYSCRSFSFFYVTYWSNVNTNQLQVTVCCAVWRKTEKLLLYLLVKKWHNQLAVSIRVLGGSCQCVKPALYYLPQMWAHCFASPRIVNMVQKLIVILLSHSRFSISNIFMAYNNAVVINFGFI